MERNTKRVLREETGRTAVWLFFSLLGWSLAVTTTPDLSPSLPVFLGGALATAVGMSAVVAAIRLRTGRELQGDAGSRDLLLLTTLFGVGFYLAWAQLSGNWTAGTTALVVVAVGTVAVRLLRPDVLAQR